LSRETPIRIVMSLLRHYLYALKSIVCTNSSSSSMLISFLKMRSREGSCKNWNSRNTTYESRLGTPFLYL